VLIKLTVLELQQENSIRPSGSNEHPVILFPFVFILSFRVICIFSTDICGNRLTEYQTSIVNIKKYASDLQTLLAVKQTEKDVETQDTCLQSIVNSDSLNV
jgi:hypothetical protein